MLQEPPQAVMHPTTARTPATPPRPVLARPRLSSRPTVRPAAPRLSPSPFALPASVQVLSAHDYAQLHRHYSAECLPTAELFPWLHAGADVVGSAASNYFGFARGQAAKAPVYRGLTTIYAESQESPSPLRRGAHHGILSSSFSSASSSSSSRSSSSGDESSSSSDYDDEPSPTTPLFCPNSVLVSSFPASLIVGLATSPSGKQEGKFTSTPVNPSAPVNLRAFGDVVKKYATVSDIVVYAKEGLYLSCPPSHAEDARAKDNDAEYKESHSKPLNPSLVATATRVTEALEAERVRRVKRGDIVGSYRVWVISDPFSTFEANHPHLVAIDSSGFQRNKLDFFQREKEEMRVLTQASEIGSGVFLGNDKDVPLRPAVCRARRNRVPVSDSSSSLGSLDDGNPMGFSICVDAHDAAWIPDAARLRDIDDALSAVEEKTVDNEWLDDVLASNASLSDLPRSSTPPAPPPKFLHPPPASIQHLSAPSSFIPKPTTSSALTAQIDALIAFALWLRDQAAPPAAHCRLPRRVLISCPDGYTESSMLALTFIMVDQGICLPEAYLYLQQQGRSFFVYQTDVELLLRIEKRVAMVLQAERESQPAQPSSSSSTMERSDSGFVEQTSPDSAQRGATNQPIVVKRERTEMRVSSAMSCPWFYSEHFEGHFPSRILPYLYLGNLNHAMNALMLKKLGITHVVSAGESALQTPRQPPFSLSSPLSSRASLPTNSLWMEQRLGTINVLDLKSLNDDGIDSIRGCFDDALAFIEDARTSGGRVLVHCRVGVSRSATLCIAYLMAYCRLDLASAYLLTRSRRLHILIQPNLPFTATLHAFEAELLRDKDEQRALAEAAGEEYDEDDDDDDFGAGLKWSNRLSFPALSREIALLNERFLSLSSATTFFDLTATSPKGPHPLKQYEGHPVLVVNVASKCGFTPQYTGLEELYKEYKDRGLVILGFPSNQFGGQEPGTDDEIASFCQLNHGVTFPLMAKSDVNGDNTNEVYKWLKAEKAGLLGLHRIKWNFEKFLIAPDGHVFQRYASLTKPESIKADIEKVLAGASKPVTPVL